MRNTIAAALLIVAATSGNAHKPGGQSCPCNGQAPIRGAIARGHPLKRILSTRSARTTSTAERREAVSLSVRRKGRCAPGHARP